MRRAAICMLALALVAVPLIAGCGGSGGPKPGGKKVESVEAGKVVPPPGVKPKLPKS